MPDVIDIESALSKLTFLDNRSPDTTPDLEQNAFATLAEYRDGGIFCGGFRGESPWEKHANGDEIVHILDGETEITIVAGSGASTYLLGKGQLIVVPKGCWHKFNAPIGVTLMTVTPQPTEHSNADRPPA